MMLVTSEPTVNPSLSTIIKRVHQRIYLDKMLGYERNCTSVLVLPLFDNIVIALNTIIETRLNVKQQMEGLHIKVFDSEYFLFFYFVKGYIFLFV